MFRWTPSVESLSQYGPVPRAPHWLGSVLAAPVREPQIPPRPQTFTRLCPVPRRIESPSAMPPASAKNPARLKILVILPPTASHLSQLLHSPRLAYPLIVT